MQYVGPFLFNAVRFALGCLVLLPVVSLRRRGGSRIIDPAHRKMFLAGGAAAGLVLFAGASLQQTGIVYTTAGKAGFITGLYVVIVPMLGLFWKQRAGSRAWAGATIAVVGLYLLSIRGAFSISLGDSLVLLGAFFWAGHLLIIGWLTSVIDPLRIAVYQYAVCSLLSFLAALAGEEIGFSGLTGAAVPILYGGLLSVGIAYTLQVVAQKEAHPAHAAVILSFEAVFAALGGWIILEETLSPRGLIGCGFMLAGVVLSQLSWGAKALDETSAARVT
jgi:drug/metabolite transporter (DMT)-like permease